MKKIFIQAMLCSLFYIYCNPILKAQSEKVEQIQPTIMVIPYTTEHQDLRTMLDSSLTTRVAITKTKEAFDERGFTTVDFVAKLKATKVDRAFTGLNQKDLKSRLIEGSGADIYVEVEAAEKRGSSGNSVRLIITAYDAFTARSMGSKTINSNTVQTDQFDRLVENALRKEEKQEGTTTKILMLEDFLNVMQTKFTDIIENGRPIKIIFELSPNAEIDFDTEVGGDGDYLKDIIDDWCADNALKNNFHFQGGAAKTLTYDEFRIPLRQASGRNLTPNRFARTIRKYFNKLTTDDGDPLTVKDESRGGTIYITFQ